MIVVGSNSYVLTVAVICLALLPIINLSLVAEGRLQVRSKRNVSLRRVIIKNEMGAAFSPISVVCKGKDADYMQAEAKLEEGEQFGFTIYDIGNRVFYCRVSFNGTLPEQSFTCYDGQNLAGGKLSLRPLGVYSKKPRKNPIIELKWQSKQ